MVVRSPGTTKVFLDEVGVVIIESTACSLTAHLVKELIVRKIKLIFCDEKHNPVGEVAAFYNNTLANVSIGQQLGWTSESKGKVWAEIVRRKILFQAEVLNKNGLEEQAGMLIKYAENVSSGDCSNREGHAAKVYFNTLFDGDFTRAQDNAVNSALNYGYAIVMSAINREIACGGFLTQIGISHHNTFNHFNLSCDLMEPFRPFVDCFVKEHNFREFCSEEKHLVLSLFDFQFCIGGKRYFFQNMLSIYCRSVFSALNSENTEFIQFPDWETVE
jgi:CRISPR-associated endonuclease Cas1 subtype II